MTVPNYSYYPYRSLAAVWAAGTLCLLIMFVLSGSWADLVLGLGLGREAVWCYDQKEWLW